MSDITERERFHACMEYEPVDHPPFWAWGAWPETLERWKREGFDPQTNNPEVITSPRNRMERLFFPNPPFERQVIEEDDAHIVYVNHEGILMKVRRDNPLSSMPQFLKFPVSTRDEFRRFWEERMQPDLTQRIGPDWRERLERMAARPVPFIVISDRWGGFFGPLRNLVGVERLCLLFYDDPAFAEEMMDRTAAFIIEMLRQILSVVQIDAFGMWEDMAYKHAPLISPEMLRKHMLPRYRKVADFARRQGVKYVGLDSDGQIDGLIGPWMDAGLNFLYPFECQCGMDVNEVRKKYGRELRLWGGLDKRAVARGPAEVDLELARVEPLIREGGYIPHLDHSCPPDTPFDTYCYYLKRLAEVCGKEC